MVTVKRKVGFAYLESSSESFNYDNLVEEIRTISELNSRERLFTYGEDKFCRLSNFRNLHSQEKVQLLFKGGKHKDRRPLINPNNENERNNPKSINEGEREQTHVIIKSLTSGILMIHEAGLDVLPISTIINYLNSKLQLKPAPFQIRFTTLAADDFEAKIDSLNRIMQTEITLDTTMVGSDYLNLTNLLDAQDRSKLVVTARRKKDITNIVRGVFNLFNNGSDKIKGVRIKGRTDDNIEVEYATDFIKRKEVIFVTKDDQGVINSNEVFREMHVILEQYQ